MRRAASRGRNYVLQLSRDTYKWDCGVAHTLLRGGVITTEGGTGTRDLADKAALWVEATCPICSACPAI